VKIVDLLTEHSLQLRLQTPTEEDRLQHEVSGSAPTELIDPTPYLPPDTLVLVTGIAMNFQEERTWDAYVERLASVPVSAIAFATGLAHRILPKGLVAACTKHEVPLLEVPSVVPPLQLDRHIENVLRAERVAMSAQGWELADKCARLANSGADLVTLLASIHGVVQSPLAIYDSFGSVLARYPEMVSWPTGLNRKPAVGITRIPLPMGLNEPCHLEVKGLNPNVPVTALLGPVSSIVALQLNRAVVVDASRHHEIRNFIEQCGAWEESSHTDVSKAFKALEFDAAEATTLLVADMSGEYASTAWQVRVVLHELFDEVRVTEIGTELYALAQRPREAFDVIAEKLLSIDPHQPLLLREPATSIDDIRLGVVHLQRLLPKTQQPTLAPELGVSAIVDVTAGRGARFAAERFLEPLVARERNKTGSLLTTLKTYLACDAHPSRTCEELFIHRNSLSYRLNKIEQLLGVNLSTIDGLTTCHLALSFTESDHSAVSEALGDLGASR
jgi:purine catabolism regulator